jgi:acyl carrier protein
MEAASQIKRVKDTVLGYLESRGDLHDLSEEDKLRYKYLENRIIDSLGIIEMIETFESEFGIRFGPEHLESDDFTTIGGLVKLIESMLEDGTRIRNS